MGGRRCWQQPSDQSVPPLHLPASVCLVHPVGWPSCHRLYTHPPHSHSGQALWPQPAWPETPASLARDSGQPGQRPRPAWPKTPASLDKDPGQRGHRPRPAWSKTPASLVTVVSDIQYHIPHRIERITEPDEARLPSSHQTMTDQGPHTGDSSRMLPAIKFSTSSMSLLTGSDPDVHVHCIINSLTRHCRTKHTKTHSS